MKGPAGPDHECERAEVDEQVGHGASPYVPTDNSTGGSTVASNRATR
jgi:hypothetical protein